VPFQVVKRIGGHAGHQHVSSPKQQDRIADSRARSRCSAGAFSQDVQHQNIAMSGRRLPLLVILAGHPGNAPGHIAHDQ